jgi:long-subunit fatty acid transport protein
MTILRLRSCRRGRTLWMCGLMLAAAGPAAAQDIILPEVPFTAKHGHGARAAGLGFAYGAVAEDGSAIWYNPAGLAQVRRIEFGAGFLHDKQERETGFDTATNGFPGTGFATATTDISQTALSHLTFAYPFPTYRGSLVLGLAYQRLAPLRTDYFREGDLVAVDGGSPGLREFESYYEEGAVDFYTAGLAGDLSPKISLGGTFSILSGSTFQEFEVGRLRTLPNGATDVNGSDEVFLSTDTRDADISGWTWSFGTLARLSERARLGITVNGQERYEFEGIVDTYLEDQEKFDEARFGFVDEITLPVSFLLSGAYTPRNFLLTADIRLTDWTQIDFEGPVRNEDRQFAYRSTADISVGAEYQLPSHPTRFRVGFSSQPVPYDIVPADVDFTFVPDDGNPNTTDDTSFFVRDYREARFESGRRFLTVGAGTLIEEALNLDVAFVHGRFERSDEDGNFAETWTTNRLYATATFRF